jgi:hypothetical protein
MARSRAKRIRDPVRLPDGVAVAHGVAVRKPRKVKPDYEALANAFSFTNPQVFMRWGSKETLRVLAVNSKGKSPRVNRAFNEDGIYAMFLRDAGVTTTFGSQCLLDDEICALYHKLKREGQLPGPEESK